MGIFPKENEMLLFNSLMLLLNIRMTVSLSIIFQCVNFNQIQEFMIFDVTNTVRSSISRVKTQQLSYAPISKKMAIAHQRESHTLLA